MAEITDIDRRVSQGMRLLDDKRPGWEERIILDRLDMANFTQCVEEGEETEATERDKKRTNLRRMLAVVLAKAQEMGINPSSL